MQQKEEQKIQIPPKGMQKEELKVPPKQNLFQNQEEQKVSDFLPNNGKFYVMPPGGKLCRFGMDCKNKKC